MPETACTPQAPGLTYAAHSFSPVCAEELGFALTVFVAAANRTLHESRAEDASLSEEELMQREHLFVDLLVHDGVEDDTKALPHQASLDSAFAALWNHYRSHASRDSICARVLSFHFLMLRTEGRAVEKWTRETPGQPETIELDAAVVNGLASVLFDVKTGLMEERLMAAVAQAHYAGCQA